MIGRLFKRLEERVEGGVGDLVGLIEDVDLETVARGAVAGGFAKIADLVDTAVGSGIDFDDIHGVSSADLGAGFADAAGLGNRMVLGAAVQSHCQDAGDGGLADASVSAEDVPVGGASLLDGVLEGAGDVLLSDDLGELLRTVFASQNGVTHEGEEMIIRDGGRRQNLQHRMREGPTKSWNISSGVAQSASER